MRGDEEEGEDGLRGNGVGSYEKAKGLYGLQRRAGSELGMVSPEFPRNSPLTSWPSDFRVKKALTKAAKQKVASSSSGEASPITQEGPDQI